MASYSDRDLSIVPFITFSFVESFVKANKSSSGEKPISRGFMYFSGAFLHDIRVQPLTNGCEMYGKCYHSQKRNEKPNEMKVCLHCKDDQPTVSKCFCTCPVGLSGACGHITGLLYQITKYKLQRLKAIPEDIAKTSQPQTWHVPRGMEIAGKPVQDLAVSGYSMGSSSESMPRMIEFTLYNPVRGEPINWSDTLTVLTEAAEDLLVTPALEQQNVQNIASRYGPVPVGCVLSYQQKIEENCIMNVSDGVGFPELPTWNIMVHNFSYALSSDRKVKLEGLRLTLQEVKKFEHQTREQRQTSLWYRIRKNRLTTSNVGEIFKRRKDELTLVQRLQSTRHVMTAAMRQGLALEPVAAKAYAESQNNRVNLYPCGVVVNLWAPWLAASPDRKVYCPDRYPAFGLLEIKCPQVSSVLEVPYLARIYGTGALKLKRNHNYYFQILTQLAVTGLEWCDLFVWCANDHHLETIYLNMDLRNEVKDKLDMFFFTHFL